VRYRNPHPHTAVLPEHRAENGRLYPAVAVEPGETLEWPIPIAGFEPLGADRTASAKKIPAVSEAAVASRAKAKTASSEGAEA